ncbi:MAG: urease accessory protein UreD [Pseudomonadota bacterium]
MALTLDIETAEAASGTAHGTMPGSTPSARAEKPVAQPRAQGAVRISTGLRRGMSRLDTLYQQGSAKVLLPGGAAGTGLEAVLLNTAGGITGGDRFGYSGSAGPGATLTLTTQAAERAYRANGPLPGTVRTDLSAAGGARIDWLPQETILFDGAHLTRSLEADLAEDATLLAVEPIIFGRTAMGERLNEIAFSDQWRIRRAGRLIYADALRLEGDGEALLARPAAFSGARAMASILYVSADAEALLSPLRTLLSGTAGASLIRPGVLAARLLAADGFALRRMLLPALRLLRGGALPKVWTL